VKYKQVIKSYSRFEKGFSLFLCVMMIGAAISLYYKILPDQLKQNKGDDVTYIEALYGGIQKLNPLYTDFNSVDQDISRLLFCGLSNYNPETGKVEESIASHTLDAAQTVYEFKIYPDAKWHDGYPVTADDVIYTYQTVIQHPKFQNRILKDTFTDIEVKKVDEQTVQFILKEPNSFFFTNTIVGLLPAHILQDVEVAELPTHEFNAKPIGCGPFQFESITKEEGHITQVRLKKFDDYFEKGGDITDVTFNVYEDFSSMIRGKDSVHGMARIPIYFEEEVEDDRFKLNPYTLPQYTALFMNTDSPFLKKQDARLGIKKAIEKQSLLDSTGYEISIDTPLLELEQDDWRNKSNIQEAMGALFDAGWSLNKEKGFRVNDKGEIFHLRLISRLYSENSKAEEITQKVVQNIEQQLKAIGIKLKVIRLPLAELEDTIMKRDYDLLLYGQSLGYNLDIYPFWHSSQTGNQGLNLSNYTNPTADMLMEGIRRDFDPDGKEEKLEKLAEAFAEDIPAVFLYTPSYYFIADKQFKDIKIPYLATPTDRLNRLHLWGVR